VEDEANAIGCTTYYKDNDGDGWGLEDDTACLCAPNAPYDATQVGDCNDNDKNTHPGAMETCDGMDNNCAGGVDEEDAAGCLTYFRDDDHDGFGQSNDERCLCSPSIAYSTTLDGDCYDQNKNAHPMQMNWFVVSRGDGSYDWNCDGLESRRWASVHEKSCTAKGNFTCGDGFCCVSDSGWEDDVPSCGDAGAWAVDCEGALDSGVFSCAVTTRTRHQVCH